MNIDRINLFYDIKNLFNTKEEAFEIYSILKSRIDRGPTNNILLVFPTKESKERNKYIIKNRTQLEEVRKDTIRDENNTYILKTLDEIIRSKDLDGIRYKEIRFLG